jgi:hypothetical protein
MGTIIEIAVLITLFAVLYQFYSYTNQSKGAERQKRCQATGIAYLTFGICAFVSKTVLSVFAGLFLMMFGFRLVAHGLDRIDKTTFIDHYRDDDTPT